MSYLAIDYWTKKTGLAISIEYIAIPLKVVEAHNLIWEINRIIKERQIEIIVIWLANHADWEESEQSRRTLKFAEILKKHIPNNIEIIFQDERYSSYEALSSLNLINNQKTKQIDDVAASIILQSYLDSIKICK